MSGKHKNTNAHSGPDFKSYTLSSSPKARQCNQIPNALPVDEKITFLPPQVESWGQMKPPHQVNDHALITWLSCTDHVAIMH